MSKRRLLIIIAGGLLLLSLGFGARYAFFLLRPVAPPPAAREVKIPSGSTLPVTADILETAGVIADAADFRLLARQSGDGKKIKAGIYDFSRPATPNEVLRRLAAGDVVKRRLTIVEGLTLVEIAKRVEAAGLGSSDSFLALAHDPVFIATLKLPATTSLEGFLFPETYLFAAGLPQNKIIATMVGEFRQRVTPDIERAAAARGLDLRKLVTLASIVQKEAGNREEMPLIASVFLNRLQRRMPLQADPTVIYGLANFNGNLTKRDLQTYTPYNTYRIAGLPAGPIANPGADALRAVAFPAATKYLYFVARGNGTHEFTTNLRDHNAAVRRYQLRRG